MTLEDIQQAIAKLSPEDRASISRTFPIDVAFCVLFERNGNRPPPAPLELGEIIHESVRKPSAVDGSREHL